MSLSPLLWWTVGFNKLKYGLSQLSRARAAAVTDSVWVSSLSSQASAICVSSVRIAKLSPEGS